MGLELAGPYKTLTTPSEFKCAEGHCFTSTVKKVRASAADSQYPVCPACAATKMAGVALVDKYGPGVDPGRTLLKWRCTQCGQEFMATFRGMRIRKRYCRNLSCI